MDNKEMLVDIYAVVSSESAFSRQKKKRRRQLKMKNEVKPKVYIAGKISGDPEYRAKFAAVASLLREKDCIVLNPAILPSDMSRAEYMRICFAMIDCSDAVWFLPDWAESNGAKLEMAYCQYIGKTTYILKEAEGCGDGQENTM